MFEGVTPILALPLYIYIYIINMRVVASFLTFRLQGFSMRRSAPYVNKIASFKKNPNKHLRK